MAIGIKIVILSYVGALTPTRIDAQELIPKYNANYHFLCFKKKQNASVGTKGHFMRCMGVEHAVLLDDSDINCKSARIAGFEGVQISRDEDTARREVIDYLNKMLMDGVSGDSGAAGGAGGAGRGSDGEDSDPFEFTSDVRRYPLISQI
jgi:hypothetical protein